MNKTRRRKQRRRLRLHKRLLTRLILDDPYSDSEPSLLERENIRRWFTERFPALDRSPKTSS